MKQAVIKAGKVCVEEVPPPTVEPGMVLVKVHRSAISSGTESGMVSGGGVLSLAMKHLRNPLSVGKLKRKLATVGIKATANIVRTRISEPSLPGYSSAGEIISVGAGVPGFKVGDRVACAGVGYACHASCNLVPHQLVTPVPDDVSYDFAALVAIGAIALQGVRRATPTLGETVVVLGLGLVGQITAYLLKCNGCHVIGFDPHEKRRLMAASQGVDVSASYGELMAMTLEATAGYGADAVIICAGTASSEVTNNAFDLCRQKGRVVVVGAVGMDLNREAMYKKEVDFLISCSYGPGRYSSEYEEKGFDYPIGYVRWTEGRNMSEFLRLLPGLSTVLPSLAERLYDIDQAEDAYKAITSGDAVTVLFKYDTVSPVTSENRVLRCSIAARKEGVGVAVVGAGAFATAVQLPILAKMPGVSIAAIVSKSGAKAQSIADRHGAALCATDYQAVLNESSVQAVFVSTRHHLHAQITLDAMAAGKHVFVEKPLALTVEDCEKICVAAEKAQVVVSVGFNRRYAPLAEKLHSILHRLNGPMTVLYRCNAGLLPADHWTLDPEQGGGRILGEAVHFFDFARWLVGLKKQVVSVSGEFGKTDDDLSATLRFSGGSTATILYTTLGSNAFPKERIEVFAGGGVAVLEDFAALEVCDLPMAGVSKEKQDKGHLGLLQNFIGAIQGKNEIGVTAQDGLEATRIAVAAMDAARTGKSREI